MQISISQSDKESQFAVSSNQCPNEYCFSKSIEYLHTLFSRGFKKNELIILCRTRRTVRTIQYYLKIANFDQFSILAISYNQFAEKILQEFSFLMSQPRYKMIGRHEQLIIIRSICQTQYDFLNYKDVLLYIIKFKKQKLGKSTFASFLKEKYFGRNNFKLPPDKEVDGIFEKIYKIYQNILKMKKMADYEDIIYTSSQIIQRNPEIIPYYNRQYKYAFIDNTNQFLQKKKHVQNFISLIFNINDASIFSKKVPFFSGSKFHLFSLNLPSEIYFSQSYLPDFAPNPCFEWNDMFQFKNFSEVSDFDCDSESGVSVDVCPPNDWVQREPDFNSKPPEIQSEPVLSDFSEEEEVILSDFDYFDSDDECDNNDSLEDVSPKEQIKEEISMIKNKLCVNNFQKKKKPLNDLYLPFEPTVLDEMEFHRNERRNSYYGQNHFLNEKNMSCVKVINHNCRLLFLSDDKIE